VIDVRSPAEFGAGHLPNAINFPVDEIEAALPLRIKDKNQLLLLHCQSAMRSGVERLHTSSQRPDSLGGRSCANVFCARDMRQFKQELLANVEDEGLCTRFVARIATRFVGLMSS
jgi:hypothetical protein